MRKVKINYEILEEEEKLRTENINIYLRAKLLRELHRIGKGQSTRLKKRIEHFSKLRPLTHEVLEACYCDLNRKLNSKYASKQSHQTFQEKQYANVLKRITRANFYQGYWIGNNCVDFFIPSLKLIIEIDGGIHNDEIKMKKDNYAERQLSRHYKIYVSRFNNPDIELFFRTMLHLVDLHKKLNSKAIKRMRRDIYINTLAHHCTIGDLAKYLGNDLHDVMRNYERMPGIKVGKS